MAKTFNYKKCIKEIKNNKTPLLTNISYWSGWNDAHDTIIDMIKENIKEVNK